VTGGNPAIRQRELGRRLRELRSDHGLTVEDVAAELMCSATKISRLETGARRPNPRDVRDLCVLYRLDEPATAELMNLSRSARERGWWTKYPDVSPDPYIGFEASASVITAFSMRCVPALLQTEEYARALIRDVSPGIDPDVERQLMEVQLRRQELLGTDGGPAYRVLVDEAALRRGVGGPGVMSAQLGRILGDARRDRVSVHLIPLAAGAHAAVDSNVVLLEFAADLSLSPVVYIEGLTANQYIERPEDVRRYSDALERLRQCALNARDSARQIAALKQALIDGAAR
jgi:transcriptional regulator with XRE-family HTH domain